MILGTRALPLDTMGGATGVNGLEEGILSLDLSLRALSCIVHSLPLQDVSFRALTHS